MQRFIPAVVLCVVLTGCTSGDAAPATTATSATSTTSDPTQLTTTTAPVATTNWWNDRVFYEVFVRSFQDSDGDGNGDLVGLIDRLDYLNDGDPNTTDDLGVTGIWLMPVMESPSYHGYDVTDYRRIDFEYGDNATFRALVDEAHRRGIAVIVDLVLNHTSKSHPWFGSSFLERPEFADWYLWRSEPGPSWHEAGDRYYFGLFWEGMPDLNLENEAVTRELYDVAEFWLTEMGVDGFRLDAVKHYVEEGNVLENAPGTYEWAAAFNEHVDAADPAAFTVGEIWSGTVVVAGYVPDQVDVAFEFSLADAMVTAAQQGSGEVLVEIQRQVLDAYPPGQYATFLTNHDQDRIASVLVGDVDKAKIAASLLLTSTGVPFIYYGEEVGTRGRKPDERIRTPLSWTTDLPGRGFTNGEPWEPFDDNADEATIAVQVVESDSIWRHYRDLIALRATHASLRTGSMHFIDSGNDAVYAFKREDEGDAVTVVINLSRDVQTSYRHQEIESGDVVFGPSWTPGAPIPPQTTIVLAN